MPQLGRRLDFHGDDKNDRNRGVPLSNLWLTLAQMIGSDRRQFGRSTGALSGLG